jgi:tetratricopeptide (TPR) repeat protein
LRQLPDSAAPYQGLISVFIGQRNWSKAWDISDRLRAARPDSRYGVYLVGLLAAESGDRLDAGEKSLREYLTYTPAPNEPVHAAAHWRLGMIREKASDKEGARSHYREALALDPKYKPALDALAKLK